MAKDVDLNLLRTLNALLAERSVSRAAERLMLSQPATSQALAKLRRHFGDELLVRAGNSYYLTPLAVQLVERIPDTVERINRIFSLQSVFEPTKSKRRFTLAVSDYSIVSLGPHISRLQNTQAPSVQLELRQFGTDLLTGTPDALQAVDGVVLPHGIILDDLPYLDLMRDEWVCLVADDNLAVGDTITEANLSDLPWVVTSWRPDINTSAIRELRHHGIEPRIQVIVDSYATLPALITGTNRIALIQRQLTHRIRSRWPVRVLPCPIPLAPLSLALWWHPSFTEDAGHQWFRTLLSDAAISSS